MSSAVSLTKEKIWVKGWAGSGNETKTHLIWFETLPKPRLIWFVSRVSWDPLGSRALTGAFTCGTLLFSLGYLLRFGGTEPCAESELAHSLLRSSQDDWQQVREMSMLLRSRLVSKVWRWNHGLRASGSLNGCMVGHLDMPRLICWRADQCTIRRCYRRY